MGNAAESRIKKPRYKKANIFLYLFLAFASFIFSLIFRAGFASRKQIKEVRKIKGPVLVIGTHHSPLDFLLMTRVMFPKQLSFVLASNLFYDKRYAWAIRLMGNAIPKKQFAADLECVKSIKKMIDNGVSIGLYPEGRVSVDGTESYIEENIAKLIKWLGVPVVLVKSCGAYLSMPRFNLKMHRGRIELSAKQIFTAEQTKQLSTKDLHTMLQEEFKYNEFEYQQNNHIAFLGKRPALGLDKLLYKCPKCKAEFKMSSQLDKLHCTQCGNTANIDKYGTITPLADGVCYPRVDLWYKYQKEVLLQEIQNTPDYTLTCEVGLAINDENIGEFNSIEHGMLTLTKNGYHYIGENGRILEFSIAPSPSIAFVTGTSIDFFRDNTIYRFCFDKVPMSTKYNIATELLHKKYFKD